MNAPGNHSSFPFSTLDYTLNGISKEAAGEVLENEQRGACYFCKYMHEHDKADCVTQFTTYNSMFSWLAGFHHVNIGPILSCR